MLHLSLDKNNRRALASAIVASGTDDLYSVKIKNSGSPVSMYN